jgi:hypothetical protein
MRERIEPGAQLLEVWFRWGICACPYPTWMQKSYTYTFVLTIRYNWWFLLDNYNIIMIIYIYQYITNYSIIKR